jgi:hypothetical protein
VLIIAGPLAIPFFLGVVVVSLDVNASYSSVELDSPVVEVVLDHLIERSVVVLQEHYAFVVYSELALWVVE